MQINKESLQKIAHLARLEFDEEGAEKMMANLSRILNWVEKLNEVDTEGIEPLTHMSVEQNVLREDVAGDSLTHENALAGAPKKDSDYFRVPKVRE